jgi:hypothetical protein
MTKAGIQTHWVTKLPYIPIAIVENDENLFFPEFCMSMKLGFLSWKDKRIEGVGKQGAEQNIWRHEKIK